MKRLNHFLLVIGSLWTLSTFSAFGILLYEQTLASTTLSSNVVKILNWSVVVSFLSMGTIFAKDWYNHRQTWHTVRDLTCLGGGYILLLHGTANILETRGMLWVFVGFLLLHADRWFPKLRARFTPVVN